MNLEDLKFNVSNHLFDNGDAYLQELASLKSKIPKPSPASASGVPAKKRCKKAGDSLRDRDP